MARQGDRQATVAVALTRESTSARYCAEPFFLGASYPVWSIGSGSVKAGAAVQKSSSSCLCAVCNLGGVALVLNNAAGQGVHLQV